MTRLGDLVRAQSGLISYTVLNYLDKSLTFAIPLVVLYAFRDKALYNEIEYIYSIAAVAAVVIEFGVSNYFLYAYRQAADRDRLVADVRGWFLLQLAAYELLGMALLAIAALAGFDVTLTYLYIFIRTIYTCFLVFFVVYYRLVDRPAKVFAYSITVNTITILLLILAGNVLAGIDLAYLFAGQAALLAATFVYYVTQRSRINLAGLLGYLKQSLAFAWPIILNVFLFMFISNYGKVYARNFLSPEEMFQISFVQRVAIIIWLAHASVVGYLSKRIFIDQKAGINRRVLALYSAMMAASVLLVFAGLVVITVLNLSFTVEINSITNLIVAYTVAWCYVAYFELYINRMNKNRYILLFSAVASVVFVAVLLLNPGVPLYTISLGMVAGMVCNLAMVLWFLWSKYGRICED